MKPSVALIFAVLATPVRAFEAHDDNADAKPLSPQEERAKFHLPPGFEIQLVAAEDEIAKPLNLNFDAAGRLWVTSTEIYPWAAKTDALGAPIPGFDKTWEEMAAYFKVPADGSIASPPEHGRDTVRVLSDFGADGKAGKIRVFADGLNIPIGVQPLPRPAGAKGDSVIVHSIPSIWKFTDTDGDGIADQRERLYTGFGFKDTHGMSSNYLLSADGWIYGCHGYANHSEVRDKSGKVTVIDSGNTYRFRPDGSKIEIYSHGQTNPFGLTEDDHGDFYTCDSHSRPAMLVLPGGFYEGINKQHDGLGFAPRIMEHDHGSSAIGGIAWYGATQFPAEFRGNTFNGNPVTRRVNRDRYEWKGSTPTAVEMPDFVSCDDPWFRPIQVKLGPDGALYIADFYNSIIGHYEMPLTDPRRDKTRGRIWRVVWRGEHGEVPVAQTPNLRKLDDAGLIGKLDDRNIVVRTMVVNELASRGGAGIGEKLRAVKSDAAKPVVMRTLAAFALSRMGAFDGADTATDDSAGACLALRLMGEKAVWGAAEKAAARGALKATDGRVRRAAASAVERHPEGMLETLLAAAIDGRNEGDPQLNYALRVAVREALNRVGGYREAAAAINGSTAPEKASQVVADTSLAVTSAEAANGLLDHLARTRFAAPRADEHLRKAMLDLPDAELGSLSKLLAPAAQLPASGQVGIAGGLAQSLATRGSGAVQKVPGEVMQWMRDTLNRGLRADEDSAANYASKAVRDLHDEGFRQGLDEVVTDPKRAVATRIEALRSLALLPDVADQIGAALNDSSAGPLRMEAAKILRNLGDARAQQMMLAALPGAAGEFATELATGLSGDDASMEKLCDLIERGKAPASLLRQRTVAGNIEKRSQVLRDRAAQLTRDLPAEDARLDGMIAARAAAYEQAKPDAKDGAKVFASICTACHQMHGQGGLIGPTLDGIRSRGVQRLVEDILDPSRNVDPLFRVATIETTDGATLRGMNVREDGDSLLFTDVAGQSQRVLAVKVKSRSMSGISPMPPGFESAIPEKDFYDLVAYLMKE
jgi:putative heme-binding domain-containing protein